MPIETIADLVGYRGAGVTEKVYRHQLKPVITKAAETMNNIFTSKASPKSGLITSSRVGSRSWLPSVASHS